MRSSLVCVGIAIAMFATACGKQEQPAAPLLPIPECSAAQTYDAAAFERLVRAMDRSGDLARVSTQFLQHRKTIEGLLDSRDPKLVPRLKPVLDAQFSEARLRARGACAFVELAGSREGVEALDAWSRSKDMQAINAAIWSRTPAPSKEEDVKMTPARKALLGEIVAAMALQQVEVNNAEVVQDAAAALLAVFGPVPLPNPVPSPVQPSVPAPAPASDPATAAAVAGALPEPQPAPTANPTSAAQPAVATAPTAAPTSAATANAPAVAPAVSGVAPTPAAAAPNAGAVPTPAALPAAAPVSVAPPEAPAPVALPPVDALVERWLAPVLIKIPDDDLADYLAFVNSRFGGDYYVALSQSYDLQAGDWHTELLKSFKDNIPPAEQTAGGPGRDALVADARRSLRDVGSPAAAADAMAKLLQADRLDPRNAEIQMLLGEAAIKTAPAMPLGPDQLRVVIDTPNYAEAERYLTKAIELAPALADAHMLLGRLRYLQGRDEEALQLYARGREIEPDHPSMDLYLGDLAYAQNQHNKAAGFYKAAVNKPERLAYVHVNALKNLLMTLRKSTQLGEYPRIADAYLAKNPQAWNFRLDYTDYLLSTDTRSDKILSIVEPIPDAWLPSRKIPALSATLVRKAVERVDKRTGEPTEESMRLMQRNMGLNPEPAALAEAMCRGDVSTRLLRRTLEVSRNRKALATALVVCSLRWQRHDVVRGTIQQADIARLSLSQPDLGGETPLCYAAATKNLAGFTQLAEAQVSPARKCIDGNTVAERLLQMSYGRDPSIVQMQIVMKRYYRRG